MGFLSGIGKKKKQEPVILSVGLLISEILKQNLNKQSGSSFSLESALVKFENFKIDFISKPGGFVLKYFVGSVRASLFIFIPDDFISKYISLKNRNNPESELVNIFGRISAYLLTETDYSEGFVMDSVKESDSLNFVGSTVNNKEEFLWNISSYKIIQIIIGSVSCFLFLDEKIFLEFNKNCLDQGITLDSIQESFRNDYTQINFDNELKVIENQADFLFGRFFLPRSARLGDHSAVSGFNSVLFKPEFEKKVDGVNFVLNLTIEDKIYNVNYFIPSKKESGNNLSKMIQTIVKTVLPLWRKYFEIQKVGGSGNLPDTVEIECLLAGGIKYKNSLIPVEIGLSQGLTNLFATKLIASGSIISTSSEKIILLNQSLLHISLKENLFLPLLLSEFLNLIDIIDVRKIIQNFFSGTGWSGSEIQSLFSYSKKDIQKNKIYYFQDPHFDRERFFKYLPKSQKEEWKQSRSVSDSYIKMISSGQNALRDIYHSFRNDHLELSYKASTLLNNEFKVHGDKKIREELDKIIGKEPFINLLEDTFSRDVQNLLAKLTAKVLANAVVFYSGSLEALEPFMSRNYRAEVKDLIKIIERKSTGNGFEMEEIRIDFFELHNGLKKLPKEELI